MQNQERRIQLFVPTFQIDDCLKEIRECLEIGWTGLGFKTVQFENDWKRYTGLPNAHFLTSNTIGLQLALRLYKEECAWGDGSEVISTPLTFVSTNHVILDEGLTPVFADVDETLCLSPESIEKKITPKTKAIIYVGMGGNSGRLTDVMEIAKKNRLILILDAAHMSGTKYKGRHAGHGLPCSVFSYQAVKNLPTGDSGMICFEDESFDKKARVMSWLGINKDTYTRSQSKTGGNYNWLYDIEYVGLKAHGNSIMAAIAIAQLKVLERDNERRRQICAQYTARLQHIHRVRFIKQIEDCVSSRHLFQIRVPQSDRDGLMDHLNAKGIFPGVHYRINTDYKMYREASGTCPNAELASRELLSLPLHMRLSDDDVQFISSSIVEYFQKN